MLYICILSSGGCLFICSLCLLLFQVNIEIVYINIMAYTGIIFFGIGGFGEIQDLGIWGTLR